MTRFLPAKTTSAAVTLGPPARPRGSNQQFKLFLCERRAKRGGMLVVSVSGPRRTRATLLVSVVLFKGLPPRFRPRRFR
jgi:hypothetical protein